MRKSDLPNIPFVEANLMGAKQKPTAISLALSSTTAEKGAALGIATFLHGRNSPARSHHYMVDSETIYQGVWCDRAAYSSPYKSINVLVCAELQEHQEDWDGLNLAALERAAKLTNALAQRYHIRPVLLKGSTLSKWEKRRWRRNGGLILKGPGVWPLEVILKHLEV